MVDSPPGRDSDRPRPWPRLALLLLPVLLAGLAVVAFRPDRPVPTIAPGSSTGPAFVVQVIRPRSGLPLGGLLPPGLFGVDAELRFDSASPGAAVSSVDPGRLRFGAHGWDLTLVFDDDGQLAPDTEVTFDLLFEDRVRTVRCRAANPSVDAVSTTLLAGSGQRSGSFEFELSPCEEVGTGAILGWPTKPLVLRGSFDRLPPATGAQPR